MTLSELLGDDLRVTSIIKGTARQTSEFWAQQFDQIIRENRGPKIKTRIVVKKRG